MLLPDSMIKLLSLNLVTRTAYILLNLGLPFVRSQRFTIS